ncbi:transient receptor potential cation channel protein painless-like [Planococcus citri]|uniref:transient receptor potential cation channel protein painless-like n=1 Tax=Planococcus citri TaxID=170843 RepID=UPI0031F938F0
MRNQEKLLSAFKERRIGSFQLLVKWHTDVDYFYGEPDNGTLLDLASRSQNCDGCEEYIFELIRRGAKVWRRDEETGKLEVHDILSSSNIDVLEYIWGAMYSRYSSSRSGNGNTNIMKVAVDENDIEVVALLARSYSIVHRNFSHVYPDGLHFILLQGSIDVVRLFIKYFDVDKEFQEDSLGRIFTCREMILQKFPEQEAELPTQSVSELQEILFFYLRKHVPELFVRRIADPEISTEILNDGRQTNSMKTYLHIACELNYVDVVVALLNKNVRPNEVASYWCEFAQNAVTPIMLAAFKGHYEIFHILLIRSDAELQNGGSGSVLHLVLQGIQFMEDRNCSTDGHRMILELLLDEYENNSYYLPLPNVFRHRLDLEHTDEDNRTALHYALKFNIEFAIKLLLKVGAKLYPTDQSILTWMSARIIKGYFDDCIRSNREFERSRKERSIIFQYKIFSHLDLYSIATKSKGSFFDRFEPVTELRKLYVHPLTKSLLYLKWRLVRKYYYINLTFYLLFCITLSTYILQIQQCVTSSTNFNNSASRDVSSILCDVSFRMWPITLLLYMILILRELCQFSVSIRRYFSIPENWLEITMIVVIGFLSANESNTHLAAIAILTSWIGLILLLGKLPSPSIYIEMFKTVALNFAKFLLLYSILIASFAYSFFILFRNKTSGHASSMQNQTNLNITDGTNENSINWWKDLQMSFIKSIIMMTGEFEASTLPLSSSFSYGHVFFILFVFLVSMVLYNLLNGLAVSDTRAIMEDAELVALISRGKLISQIERLAFSNPFPNVFKCRATELLERGYIFSRNKLISDRIRFDETKWVKVYPTKNNRIEIYGEHFGKMPSTIVKQAEEIVEKREQSKLAKNKNKNSLTDVAKNNSSERQFINELVHQFSEQMSGLKLENDSKIAALDEKFDKMMNKSFENQNSLVDVTKNNLSDSEHQSVSEQIRNLKLEVDCKIAARDEKLLQNVDQRFDKINKLLESVLQEANLLKNKD